MSGEVVEGDNGADDFFPDPLDWIYSDEDGGPTMALLNTVEEDFNQEVKVACSKSKGKRKLFNLKSSVNYGDSCASNWRRKDKVHER